MANQEHLKILRQGTETWNQWRKENPETEPDLSEITFVEDNLSKRNFTKTNFTKAQFWNTCLWESNLKGANLKEANLWLTNIHNTNLKGATLENASLFYSVFANVDLNDVSGLDTIWHIGPSTIGIDTLYKSKGNISETFLRGCGLPDAFIECARSLAATCTDYSSCFISYTSNDEEFAKLLYNDLQETGIRCWLVPHDLEAGVRIRPTVDESILAYDKLLLILSEHSVVKNWVEKEVKHALDLEKERSKPALFPVRVDDAVMESKTDLPSGMLRARHIGDFRQWKDHEAYMKSFGCLLRDLKSEQARQ